MAHTVAKPVGAPRSHCRQGGPVPLPGFLFVLYAALSSCPSVPQPVLQRLLPQQVSAVWISHPLFFETGSKSCCSLHVCATRGGGSSGRVSRGEKNSWELCLGE